MLRQTFTAFAVVALGLRDPVCGGVDGPEGGPNAPCTRSSDCGGSLVCLEGVCREPDAGQGNGRRDSGAERDSGGDQDASEPPAGDAGDGGV